MKQKTFIRLGYLFLCLLMLNACKKKEPNVPPAVNSRPQVAAPANPVAEAGTHIVAKGETLFQIAQQYGLSIDELKKQNPALKNDSDWKVGLKLNVKKPTTSTVQPKPVASSPAPAPSSSSSGTEDRSKWRYYTLQDGETLYRVSKKHDISVENLLKLNPILKDKIDDLPVGQKIRVR